MNKILYLDRAVDHTCRCNFLENDWKYAVNKPYFCIFSIKNGIILVSRYHCSFFIPPHLLILFDIMYGSITSIDIISCYHICQIWSQWHDSTDRHKIKQICRHHNVLNQFNANTKSIVSRSMKCTLVPFKVFSFFWLRSVNRLKIEK